MGKKIHYKKRIQAYKTLIQEQYVKDSYIQNVIQQSKHILNIQENTRTSYFEFLWQQSKFIKKRWWFLQGIVLILLWLLLRDVGSAGYTERILGILASVFVILIIPEIWKNRNYSATEIECSSFYSLRQICAARTILFAIVDVIMVTLFFMISYHTIQISLYRMAVNFLIPFNVSTCICFRLLYSKRIDTEYTAVFTSMMWILIWSAIATQNSLYHIIAEPVWFACTLLSFGFLIYFIQKSWLVCEEIWEDHRYEINT